MGTLSRSLTSRILTDNDNNKKDKSGKNNEPTQKKENSHSNGPWKTEKNVICMLPAEKEKCLHYDNNTVPVMYKLNCLLKIIKHFLVVGHVCSFSRVIPCTIRQAHKDPQAS